MSNNDAIMEMTRNFANLYGERDNALQELALANSHIKDLENEILRFRQDKYHKTFEEIRGIIQTFPNENSSIDWEAKAHRAIEIVKQIKKVLKDERN